VKTRTRATTVKGIEGEITESEVCDRE